MRGFSPRLVLSKQIYPLFADGIAAVRGNPALYQAIRTYAKATRNALTSDSDPYYAKHMGDAGNLLIEAVAYYHHLLKERQGLGVGATLGKLQKTAYVHGFASPRRVTMYVKRLVQIGRLSYSEDVRDKRVRRLIPGPELRMTAFRYTRDLMRAADVLWPQDRYSARIDSDQRFFEAAFISMMQSYTEGADPLRPFPDVRHFTSKDAGGFLLGAVLFGALEFVDKLDPATEFTLSYSGAAAESGVSRTHVRNVIEAAERQGLVTKLGEGGRAVRLTERMIQAYERYFACQMILIRKAGQDATALAVAADGMS